MKRTLFLVLVLVGIVDEAVAGDPPAVQLAQPREVAVKEAPAVRGPQLFGSAPMKVQGEEKKEQPASYYQESAQETESAAPSYDE